jgi:hypothetical protein
MKITGPGSASGSISQRHGSADPGSGSGSTLKCHGSATLLDSIDFVSCVESQSGFFARV